MSVILITGASTGIGNLTARRLAGAGHTVYASMRDPAGRNTEAAAQMRAYAHENGTDLHVISPTPAARATPRWPPPTAPSTPWSRTPNAPPTRCSPHR